MKIIIVADSEQKQGGNNEVIKHIIKALDNNNSQIVVNYINREKYFPKYLPKRFMDLFRLFYLYHIANDNYFDQFDIAITLQPDSHCIRHKNHIIYFQHHIKQYYDLFWYSFRQRRKLRKKIIFLLLTIMNRFADMIYLTPNLKKARIIVNSQTVGERLRKYNKISNFIIINPGFSIPPSTIEADKIQQKEVFANGLKRINNDKFLILSFCRLNLSQKGIDILFDTALLMPLCDFIIAGPYDATMESIDIGTLPKNIRLIPKDFSDEEKTNLFKRCDVFIAPYRDEDFGITPIEANAYGKPVVYCNDSGEIKHTQKHKITGYMSKRNPKNIVEGIQYCLIKKEEMKKACMDNALNFTNEKFESYFRTFLFQ